MKEEEVEAIALSRGGVRLMRCISRAVRRLRPPRPSAVFKLFSSIPIVIPFNDLSWISLESLLYGALLLHRLH